MGHELLTNKNHRVRLANGLDNIPQNRAYNDQSLCKTFTHLIDTFFSKNMYAEFGAVGQSLKQLVEEYQTKIIFLVALKRAVVVQFLVVTNGQISNFG